MGSDFIIQTKASFIYNEENDNQTLLINSKHLSLEYLFLHEITGRNAIIDIPEKQYEAIPKKIISDHITFSKEAFDIFGSEEKLNNRACEILQEYGCINTENTEIQQIWI